MDPDLCPTPTELLAQVRAVRSAVVAGEVELLQLGVAWADSHPDLSDPADRPDPDEDPHHDPLVPAMDWAAGAAFAAAIGRSSAAGEAFIRDGLALRHRLPRLWARLLRGEVEVWRARRVAQAVHGAPADVATHLDRAIAGIAHKVGSVTLDRLLDEAMLRLHPEEREIAQLEALDARHATLHEETINDTGVADMTLRADWKDLKDFDDALSRVAALLAEQDQAEDRAAESLDVRRSRAIGVLADPTTALALLEGSPAPVPQRWTTLFVHLSAEAIAGLDPVGRCENTARAVLEQQIRSWCGRTDSHLTVTPVLDLSDHTRSDAYEARGRLRDRSDLVAGRCVFPFCGRPARRCDHDHVVPHAEGGETCDCNIAPLCRRHHRLKTHAGWRYTVVETGVWLWSDPHGQQFLRDGEGTLDVTPPGRAVSGCRVQVSRTGAAPPTARSGRRAPP